MGPYGRNADHFLKNLLKKMEDEAPIDSEAGQSIFKGKSLGGIFGRSRGAYSPFRGPSQF